MNTFFQETLFNLICTGTECNSLFKIPIQIIIIFSGVNFILHFTALVFIDMAYSSKGHLCMNPDWAINNYLPITFRVNLLKLELNF